MIHDSYDNTTCFSNNGIQDLRFKLIDSIIHYYSTKKEDQFSLDGIRQSIVFSVITKRNKKRVSYR